ncbi:MAG TPA: hypothetical protein VE085_11205 [Burkholderiales bacterium]|nr:hypothetical protein [Burkholderiales bacterium]
MRARHLRARNAASILELTGAVVLILMGLYMLNAFFIFVPELAV